MKDSGIEWIGEIPEGWEIHRIKTHFSIISGSGFKPELQGQSTGDFPVCKASDISSSGHYLHTSANYISSDIVKSQHFSIIPKGSILFAKIGEAMRKNNRSLCSLDCCVDNNCLGLVPKNISSEFSYYLFTCIDMTWFDNAGTIPCINNQKLYDCRIPFPSYGEQLLIANHLNIQCDKINEMLFHIRASIEEYKKLKQAVITQAVTKGVRGEREMKDSGVEWIGEIPAEWSICPLKRLAAIQTGSTPSKTSSESFYSSIAGTPWIKPDNLGFSSSIETTAEFLTEEGCSVARILPSNTVYVGCIGSRIGNCGYSLIPCACNQQINALIFNARMYWKYGWYLTIFQEEQYMLLANGNVIQIINSTTQGNISCIVPSISEQREITAYLDAKCAEIDGLIEKKEQLVKELESYKKSLIYEVVTGKREV